RLAFRQHRTLWRADFPHPDLLVGARSPGLLGHIFIIVEQTSALQTDSAAIRSPVLLVCQ
ncbi:MAG: hypothetical protein ABI700_29730, partial [Chloroflexota bacterium]